MHLFGLDKGMFFFVCFELLLHFLSLHALRENNKTLSICDSSQPETDNREAQIRGPEMLTGSV